MSYPAACRAYERAVETLRKLIAALKEKGINVEELSKEFEVAVKELSSDTKVTKLCEMDHVILIISQNSDYVSLEKSADDLKGYYENMKEEEIEWFEGLREDVESDHEPMYGGVSDDWEDYLDKIGYDKSYD
jgi:hypothetical protein